MIDPKELRINNYILHHDRSKAGEQYKHGIVSQISDRYVWVDNDKVNSFSVLTIRPITLTEEILLRCGFEISIDKNNYSEYTLSVIKPDNGCHCGIKLFSDSDFIEEGLGITMFPYSYNENEFDLSSDGTGFICSINYKRCLYLHHLQNLFYCLTGKELEVRL